MPIEKELGVRLLKRGIAYTTITNEALNSIKNPVAIAIWVHLCSKPESWVVRRQEIMDRFDIGRDKYQDCMRELRELGLVWDFQNRDLEGGFTDRGVVCSNTLPIDEKSPSTGFIGRPILPEDGSAGRRQIRPLSNKRVSIKEILPTNEIVIPLGINHDAWNEWIDFRKSKRKPVSQRAANKQFELLNKYSEDQQRHIINQSISNDYQGLFEPKGGANGTHQRSDQQRPDNSAAGRVRANIARARAERAAIIGGDGGFVGEDVIDVRPQMGEQLRGSSGPGQGMGSLIEGDFSRAD